MYILLYIMFNCAGQNSIISRYTIFTNVNIVMQVAGYLYSKLFMLIIINNLRFQCELQCTFPNNLQNVFITKNNKCVEKEFVIKHISQFTDSQRDCFKNHHITVEVYSRSHKFEGFFLGTQLYITHVFRVYYRRQK